MIFWIWGQVAAPLHKNPKEVVCSALLPFTEHQFSDRKMWRFSCHHLVSPTHPIRELLKLSEKNTRLSLNGGSAEWVTPCNYYAEGQSFVSGPRRLLLTGTCGRAMEGTVAILEILPIFLIWERGTQCSTKYLGKSHTPNFVAHEELTCKKLLIKQNSVILSLYTIICS